MPNDSPQPRRRIVCHEDPHKEADWTADWLPRIGELVMWRGFRHQVQWIAYDLNEDGSVEQITIEITPGFKLGPYS